MAGYILRMLAHGADRCLAVACVAILRNTGLERQSKQQCARAEDAERELRVSDTRFIAVSNREPYIHRFEGDHIDCVQPASGLTMALDPIMRATGGTWIAHGSGDADRATVDLNSHIAVPPGDPSYTLRRVWLDKALEDQYYYGLSNEGLWPLCHVAFHRPVFRRSRLGSLSEGESGLRGRGYRGGRRPARDRVHPGLSLRSVAANAERSAIPI